MSEIDIDRLKRDAAYWDEIGAPKDATHYVPSTQIYSEGWLRGDENYADFMHIGDREREWLENSKVDDDCIIPRPTKPEWVDGLPPVGCECEYDTSVNHWVPAKCIAIGHDRHEAHAVIQTTNRLFLVDDVARLRPLKSDAERLREELAELVAGAARVDGVKDVHRTVADALLNSDKFKITRR